MANSSETLDEPVANSTLSDFAIERTQTTARVAIVIATDAALFLIWVANAWIAHLVADLARTQGVNEYFADAFLWISSASTLMLTVLYIAADIRKEFRRVFHHDGRHTEVSKW